MNDEATIYEQLELPPAPVEYQWHVAVRVKGEIQQFMVAATSYRKAFEAVKKELPEATVTIVRMK